MTRRVVIATDCDTCQAPAVASFVVGALEQAGPSDTIRPALHTIDACADHVDMWRTVVTTAAGAAPFRAAGRPPGPTTAPRPYAATPGQRARVACEICGTEVNRGSLIGHIWEVHASMNRPAQPEVCPECGAAIAVPNLMGTHRTRVHGWDAVAAAYDAVRPPAPKSRRRAG